MDFHKISEIADWPIRRFLLATLGLQTAAWSFASMNLVGYQLPLVQPLYLVLYYTLVPGFIILRVLRVHNIAPASAFVYAVGLSIAFQMLVGVVANFGFPYIAVTKPISALPLSVTMGGAVGSLWILCRLREQNSRAITIPDRSEVRLSALLYLALPPLLAIVGTHLENHFGTNVVLLLTLVFLATFPLVIGLTKFVPEVLYPAAVFSASLALLYHSSLISANLWGWDVFSEYYVSSSVLTNGLWDPSLASNVNAMLSTAILAPAYSLETGISLVWVFKLVYPFLFAFAPTTLYMCFRRQIPSKLAFVSAFLFIGLFVFYVEMIFLPRQQVAELFLALIALLLVEKRASPIARSILLTAFSFGLVVSHYGVTYLFLGSLLAAWLFARFARRVTVRGMSSVLRPSFIISFATFALAWYLFVSSSSNFSTIVRFGSYLEAHFLADFLNPRASQPVDILLTGAPSPLHTVAETVHLISQFVIGVGVFIFAMKRSRLRVNEEFSALAS